MTASESPDPARAAGLEPGGGVQPGDTPPMADSMSEAGPSRDDQPNMGPISGNRTPMVIALVVLAIVVLMSAVAIVAQLLPS